MAKNEDKEKRGDEAAERRISHHLLQREQLPAGPGARISVSCLSSDSNVHLHELKNFCRRQAGLLLEQGIG